MCIRDRFYQADSYSRIKLGTGLGLYITDRIVRLLGGNISTVSKLREGTVFSITLPAPVQAESRQSAYEQAIGYHGRRLKILIVDDNASNRDVVAQLLDQVGFSIVDASSVAEALQLLTQHSVDAVISDIRMPGQTGEDLCRTVRNDAALAKTVMIASSASVSDTDQQLALRAGFSGFVPKPVKEEVLFSVLGRALQIDWIIRPMEELGILSDFSSPTEAAERPLTESLPPVEVQRRLQALAEEGDIVGLRREVDSIGTGNADYRVFQQRLRLLVDAFRIDDLEQVLRRIINQSEESLVSTEEQTQTEVSEEVFEQK